MSRASGSRGRPPMTGHATRLAIIALVCLWASPGSAEENPEQVPVADEFSPVELALTGVGFVAGPAVLLAGPRVVQRQPATFAAPREGTIDYAVSSALHGNLQTGNRVLGGWSDPTLLAAPWAAFLFYGTSALWSAVGRPWLGQRNIAHSAIAYAEGLGWTSLLVGSARLLVRRDRPWVALDRPQFARDGIEPTTSLASSHTALGATFGAFVTLDLAAYLARQLGPGWRALPYPILSGFVVTASIAHVADQENFLSDELAGLVIGTISGAAAWFRHFDSSGQPRARRLKLTLMPGRLGDGWGLFARGRLR